MHEIVRVAEPLLPVDSWRRARAGKTADARPAKAPSRRSRGAARTLAAIQAASMSPLRGSRGNVAA